MPEPVYGLTAGAAKVLSQVVDKHRQVLPPAGRRTRRVLESGGGGIELSHGIIIQSCNIACSAYRVQRVHRFLSAECDGSGSGSGSGT